MTCTIPFWDAGRPPFSIVLGLARTAPGAGLRNPHHHIIYCNPFKGLARECLRRPFPRKFHSPSQKRGNLLDILLVLVHCNGLGSDSGLDFEADVGGRICRRQKLILI